MAGTSKIRSLFVTTTAGEDETSEGNPENSKRDAVDVVPSVPAPEDEAAAEPALENDAAAEPTTTEPAMAEPARREPVIANRTENDNYSSRSMPPKKTVCYQQREWQHTHFLGKNTTMNILGQWKQNGNGSASRQCRRSHIVMCWLFGDPSACNAKIVGQRCVGQPEELRSGHYHDTCHDEPDANTWAMAIATVATSSRSWRCKRGSTRSSMIYFKPIRVERESLLSDSPIPANQDS